MKRITRREMLRAGAGSIVILGAPGFLIGCKKTTQKGNGDAATSDTIRSDSGMWVPDAAASDVTQPDSGLWVPDAATSDVTQADSGLWVPEIGEEVYNKLGELLHALPNGFPATPDNLEIDLLKMIFTMEEADLFCDLRLAYETAGQIAERTGRPIDGLEEALTAMAEKREILGVAIGGMKLFQLQPWVLGIYEGMVDRMDRDFCELVERYHVHFGTEQLFAFEPQLMQVVPISETIPDMQQALPYQQVSAIIDQGQQFRVNECICRKHQKILEHPCAKPEEVCLVIINVPDAELLGDFGREISKEEAYRVLDNAEQAGLVHLTSNQQTGNTYICNCCGCCCGMLRGVDLMGEAKPVVNSAYCAEIDPEVCESCGTCINLRCQVKAIEQDENSSRVIEERCIGCGLCVTTCSTGAARLVPKPESEITPPPVDGTAWMDERAENRGVDYSQFK